MNTTNKIPKSIQKIRKGRKVIDTIQVMAHERSAYSGISAPSKRLVTLWEAHRTVKRATDLMQMCNARLTKDEKVFVAKMQEDLTLLNQKRR